MPIVSSVWFRSFWSMVSYTVRWLLLESIRQQLMAIRALISNINIVLRLCFHTGRLGDLLNWSDKDQKHRPACVVIVRYRCCYVDQLDVVSFDRNKHCHHGYERAPPSHLWSVLVGVAGSLVSSPNNAAALVGGDISFQCRTDAASRLAWQFRSLDKRSPTLVVYDGSRVAPNFTRYSVTSDRPGQFDLQIRRTEMADAGMLTCIETSRGENASAIYTVMGLCRASAFITTVFFGLHANANVTHNY